MTIRYGSYTSYNDEQAIEKKLIDEKRAIEKRPIDDR